MKKHFSAAALLALASLSAQAADIVDTAVGAGNFKTLVTALKAAGLVDTLNRLLKYWLTAPKITFLKFEMLRNPLILPPPVFR